MGSSLGMVARLLGLFRMCLYNVEASVIFTGFECLATALWAPSCEMVTDDAKNNKE